MHFSKTSPAPIRKAILLLLRGTMIVILVAAVMVARASRLTSESGLHTAAPRFTAQVTTPKKTVVVAPAHKAAQGLLPVVDQEDILPRHRILADKVLRALPSHCRDNLQNFYVNYDKNAANRGLGGEKTIIIIGTVPDREFMALLIHECGHVTDLGGLRGSQIGGGTSFFDGNTPIYGNDPSVAFYALSWISADLNHPGSKDSDFVSGYAAADPFEDFAEAYAFFALQKDVFKKLAEKNPVLKAKYDFMDQVVFANKEPVAQGQYVPKKNVPWDVTKLPYVWHAKK